jgi:hypothetical protein
MDLPPWAQRDGSMPPFLIGPLRPYTTPKQTTPLAMTIIREESVYLTGN